MGSLCGRLTIPSTMMKILDFLGRLGCEYSLFENCSHVTFPADFLWFGLLMLFALWLSSFIHTNGGRL